MQSGPGNFITLLVALLIAFEAPAARQQPMTLDEVIAQSGRIVEAEVIEVTPTAGNAQSPRTRVVLQIARALAGSSDATLVLWLPEGIEADGITWSGYEGLPAFAPGERYLLFLRSEPWRVSPIVEWTTTFLRRASVAGQTVWVDAHGACVDAIERDRVTFGPRVAEPPPLPGRGAVVSSEAIEPSAIDDCLPATALVTAIESRMRMLAWVPGPVHEAPVDWSLVVETAEPPR